MWPMILAEARAETATAHLLRQHSKGDRMRVTSPFIELPRPRAGLFVCNCLQILKRETNSMPRGGDTLQIPLRESELIAKARGRYAASWCESK
jgi:hypothetical protein